MVKRSSDGGPKFKDVFDSGNLTFENYIKLDKT